MGRKRKTNVIEDLLDIATLLSWKVSVLVAIITFYGFHYLSGLDVAQASNAKSVIDSIPKQLLIGVSKILQYAVPIIFIFGAILSVLGGERRRKLLDQQTGLDSIRAMSWQEFEMLVGEAYRRKGYTVRENGGGGADGGIDLYLVKEGKRSVVQCKRWKTTSINVSLVRELYGVMTGDKADSCIFVTSGSYTPEAKMFAQGKPITLVDGKELFELIATVQSNLGKPKNEPLRAVQPNIQNAVFSCPICGGSMVKRTAKRGANAGSNFLGCANYPQCRGTIAL